jgi:hypothetical protein
MASRLHRAGFADGAVFHAYHGYECVISALIAARGYAVPPEGWTRLTLPSGRVVAAYPSPGGGVLDRSAHRARLLLFAELSDRSRPYARTHAVVSRFLTLGDRMNSLYYDPSADLLPQDRYTASFAMSTLSLVHRFAREVWQEIR